MLRLLIGFLSKTIMSTNLYEHEKLQVKLRLPTVFIFSFSRPKLYKTWKPWIRLRLPMICLKIGHVQNFIKTRKNLKSSPHCRFGFFEMFFTAKALYKHSEIMLGLPIGVFLNVFHVQNLKKHAKILIKPGLSIGDFLINFHVRNRIKIWNP